MKHDELNDILTFGFFFDEIKKFAIFLSCISVIYQIIVLSWFSNISYFSWNQVVNDTIILGIVLYVFYILTKILVTVLDANLILPKKNIPFYLLDIPIMIVLIVMIYISDSHVTLILFFILGTTFGLKSRYIKENINNSTSKDLSNKFKLYNLLIIVIITIVGCIAYYNNTYKNAIIVINGNQYALKYMNDLYIITEKGVFDRDGNSFSRQE